MAQLLAREIDYQVSRNDIRRTLTLWLRNETDWNDREIDSFIIPLANQILSTTSPYGSPFMSVVHQYVQQWVERTTRCKIEDKDSYTPEEMNDFILSLQEWHAENNDPPCALFIPPRVLWDSQYRQRSEPIQIPVNPFTSFLAKRKIAEVSENATDTPSTSTVTNGIESNSDQNGDVPEEGHEEGLRDGLNMEAKSISKHSFDAIEKFSNKGMDDSENVDLITDQYIAEHLQKESTGKQAQSGQLPSTSGCETAGPSKRRRTTSETTTTTLTSSSLTEPCPGRLHRDSCATEISVDHVQCAPTSTLKSPDSTSSSNVPVLDMVFNTSGKQRDKENGDIRKEAEKVKVIDEKDVEDEDEENEELKKVSKGQQEPADNSDNTHDQLKKELYKLENMRNHKIFFQPILDMRRIIKYAEEKHPQKVTSLTKDFKVYNMKKVLEKINKVSEELTEGFENLNEIYERFLRFQER